MAVRKSIVLLSMIAAAPPALAAAPEQIREGGAPLAPANAKYCLRVEAVTGTRLEEVQCWTRAQWAEREVDVDKDWAEEGVRIISDRT